MPWHSCRGVKNTAIKLSTPSASRTRRHFDGLRDPVHLASLVGGLGMVDGHVGSEPAEHSVPDRTATICFSRWSRFPLPTT